MHPDTRALLDRLEAPYWRAMVRERARVLFHAKDHGPVVELDAMRHAVVDARAEVLRRLAVDE